MHFDRRPDIGAAQTLLAAAWLDITPDGIPSAETLVWNSFEIAQAPDARGLFLGHDIGLVGAGSQFLSLLALSSTDTANRTDVYLLRVRRLARLPPQVAARGAPERSRIPGAPPGLCAAHDEAALARPGRRVRRGHAKPAPR